jgi:hypothetical protein
MMMIMIMIMDFFLTLVLLFDFFNNLLRRSLNDSTRDLFKSP